MTVLATDAFTRADSANLGGNWTAAKGHFTFGIVGNKCGPQTSNREGSYYSAVAAPNDQYSQALVSKIADVYQCVTVRNITSGTSRNYYGAGNDPNDFGTGSRIWKEVADVITSLGTGATTLAVGQTWYLEAQGTALKMKINGTLEISVTDSSFSSGQFGVSGFDTAAPIALFDDWEGGDFGDGSGAGGGIFDDRWRARPPLFMGNGTGSSGVQRAAWPDETMDFFTNDNVNDSRSRFL